MLQSANKVLDSVPDDPRRDDDLPKLEIDKFSGDPLEYQYFISVFKDSVEAKCKDPGKSLLRLLQYTKRPAKKAISHCAIIGGKKGLNEAKSILRERFGEPFMIAESIMNNLKTCSQARTPTEIRSLADELSAAVTTLSEISMLKEIDTQSSIKLIISRLPLHVQRRWSKLAFEKKRDERCYPGILELAEFLTESADLINDPGDLQYNKSSFVPCKKTLPC